MQLQIFGSCEEAEHNAQHGKTQYLKYGEDKVLSSV